MKYLYFLRITLCLLPFNVSAMDNIISGYEFSADPDLNRRIHANLDLIESAFGWTNDPELNTNAYNELLAEGFTTAELSEARNSLITLIKSISKNN